MARIEWVVRYRSPASPDVKEWTAIDQKQAEDMRLVIIQSGFTLIGDIEERPIPLPPIESFAPFTGSS